MIILLTTLMVVTAWFTWEALIHAIRHHRRSSAMRSQLDRL